MANIIRSSKSGSQWTQNDLIAFNIRIVEQNSVDFFGVDIKNINISDYIHRIDNSDDQLSADLKNYIKLVSTSPGEESAVVDFAATLLRLLKYTDIEHFVRVRKRISLFMCGEQTIAETDVCIMSLNQILFLLQVDKTLINNTDPEPQLIAEAIAAFQNNYNINKRYPNSKEYDKYIFPGITMIGTYPTFYKINITNNLNNCIKLGIFPKDETIIYRFNPIIDISTSRLGIQHPDNKLSILKAFKAFRQFMPF
ncbi:hypothetical protein BB561_003589 [Smittium simulii]|uniref:Uncharacterized protein n=1 Tax=Smittium simulii TaxID=133385 RepID=A0A2T9YKH3_9FUNG|nr:hypothetical protein BB561_003589 [Smittium simulii]